jgi:site-specific DNA-adenine methylase
MFKYSGNKQRLLHLLRQPPKGPIIEPFAGSARYSLNYDLDAILFEKNKDVYDLWDWLINDATKKDLLELEKMKQPEKVDIRLLNLPKPQETLFRLTCASVYVGQLSSWISYPQHKVDFSRLISYLPQIKYRFTLGGTDYLQSAGLQGTYFIDPPYMGTSGNYIDGSNKKELNSVNLNTFTEYINSVDSPIIFTYGTDAQEVFPQYQWELVLMRRVPKIRTGGTANRIDYVFYKNFSIHG